MRIKTSVSHNCTGLAVFWLDTTTQPCKRMRQHIRACRVHVFATPLRAWQVRLVSRSQQAWSMMLTAAVNNQSSPLRLVCWPASKPTRIFAVAAAHCCCRSAVHCEKCAPPIMLLYMYSLGCVPPTMSCPAETLDWSLLVKVTANNVCG